MSKKLLSMAIAIVMIASLFTGMMAVQAETPEGYLVYEEFGATAPSDWVVINQNTSTISPAVISTVETSAGSGNYVLKLSTASAGDVAMAYLLGGGEGISLTEDKDVVIETKFKHYNSAARVDFKINMGATNNNGIYTANSSERFNYYRTVMALHETKGIHAGTVNRDGSNNPIVDTTIGDMSTGTWASGAASDDLTGTDWYTVKVTYKGTTGRADVVITDPFGKELKYTDIFTPFNDWASANSASVTSTLSDIGFRSYALDSDGPKAFDYIYVDYVKISEKVTIKASAPGTVKSSDNIAVKFTKGYSSFVNAVTLKDKDGNTVASQKTYDAATQSVIINPDEDLAGGTYTVSIDKTVIEATGNMFDETTATLTFKVSTYIVDEDFGATVPSNWVVINQNTSNISAATLSTEEVEDGNYALKLSTSKASDVAMAYLINGGNGIAMEDGKNVVIETKFKHLSPTARADFKINTGVTNSNGVYTANSNERFNYYYTVMALHETKGIHAGSQNRDNAGNLIFDTTIGDMSTGTWASGNDWYTVKVEYKGVSGKADVTITDPAGQKLTYTDIYAPFNAYNSASTAYVTETLKDIGFRAYALDSDGPKVYDFIWVDYLKVSEKYTIKASVPTTLKPEDNVPVTFTKGNASFVNAVTLKDKEGNAVASQKTYDAATQSVIINPDDDLAAGTYTVSIDKTVIEATGNMFDETTATLTFKVSSYIIDEDFGSTVPANVVKINQNASTISSATITTEEVEAGNYALKLSGTRTDIAAKYLINGEDGIALTDGKNVVIETKFKHSAANTRADFKINMGDTISGTNHIANANERFNYYRTVVGLHETKGVHAGTINRDGSNNPIVDTTIGDMTTGTWASGNDWYTVKVEYKGVSGKADVTITDPDGQILTYTDTFVPFNDWASNSSASVTTNLKDVGFRALAIDSDGPIATDTVYVDYLRVYEKHTIDVAVPEVVSNGQKEITVVLDTLLAKDAFKNYVKLYESDGTTLVDTTNTMDLTTNTVTLTAGNDFVDGESYIIKIDKEALSAAGVVVTNISDSYAVTVSKYIINDTFDSGLDGWTLYSEGQGVLDADTVNGFMTFTNTRTSINKEIAIKRFASPIAHKDGKYTVVETRIKNTNGGVATLFKVNINPEINTNWEHDRNNYTLFGIGNNYTAGDANPQNFSFLYADGKAVNAYGNVLLQRMWDVAPDTVNGTWFTVKARFDKENPNFVLLTVTNETTSVTSTVTADMRTWDGEGEVTDADYSTLKSFAVRMGKGATDTAVVDYVRVSYEDKEEVTPDYEVAIVNAAGEEVTSLTAGETYYCHYKATADELTNVSFIYALYKNDELVNMSVESRCVLNHSDRSDAGFRIAAAEDTDAGDVYSIKAFAWSDLTGLKPLTTAATAKVE